MGKIFKFALALFLIGVGLLGVFSVISEEPLLGSIRDEENYEYQELVYDASDFSGFTFLLNNRDVIIEASEDDQIRVQYYTSEDDDIIVNEEGSSLSLTKDVEWYTNWFSWGVFYNDEIYDLILYVPTSVTYDVNIETANGTLSVSDLDNISEFDFDTSNGRLTLENMSFDTLELSTSNGGCYLTNVSVVSNLDVNTSNGKIVLTDVTANEIEADTSNGKIIATNITAFDIDLDTSNGDIELTVIGDADDYEVDADTSNGDISWDGLGITDGVVNADAPYKIKLRSSNGDIDIVFS